MAGKASLHDFSLGSGGSRLNDSIFLIAEFSSFTVTSYIRGYRLTSSKVNRGASYGLEVLTMQIPFFSPKH